MTPMIPSKHAKSVIRRAHPIVLILKIQPQTMPKPSKWTQKKAKAIKMNIFNIDTPHIEEMDKSCSLDSIIKTEDKTCKTLGIIDNDCFSKQIMLEDMPLIYRIHIQEPSIFIHKTSDCRQWKCDYCHEWVQYQSDEEVIAHLCGCKTV
eukprot:50336_1